jgi:cytochrome c oxidase cbb3-type subunit 2
MARTAYRPGKKVSVAAVLTVAATYGYFLLFAQFGFLQAVVTVAGAGAVKPVMGAMGLAGVAGSVVAAMVYRERCSRRLLAAGLGICAVAAGLSLLAESVGWLLLVAALVGLGTGGATVTLASLLSRAVGRGRLGVVIGLGTGLAYAFCNLPGVFTAGPRVQAGLAMLLAVAGALATRSLTLDAPAGVPEGFDYSLPGQGLWTLIFTALVGLDSAAFYIIQHTPVLQAGTWTGSGRLLANAGGHLSAALLAGYALDRRRAGWTVGAGAIALLAAGGLLGGSAPVFAGGALLYAAGVSVYSTALVYYPASGRRPGLVALVYGVAGWGGSALGIGLAEDRHVLPGEFIVLAGGVILGALLVRWHYRRPEAAGEF